MIDGPMGTLNNYASASSSSSSSKSETASASVRKVQEKVIICLYISFPGAC